VILFRDYIPEATRWITFVEGDFYPDALEVATPIYEPVLTRFGELLTRARDSCELLILITAYTRSEDKRIQLLRVFKRYVSPDTSVEMLKKKRMIPKICEEHGNRFRDIQEVRQLFTSRPHPDETLIALLNEYRTRGQKGYTLTAALFDWFHTNLGDSFDITGPTGAGKDLNLHDWFPSYPNARRPVDFIITEVGSHEPLVIGLARYDSDRGGAQEDDRTSGYRSVISEVLGYSASMGLNLKLLFINDGPGLLLGSMWRDYCELEEISQGRVMVATLKMLKDRLTPDWIRS
jgi:hypothetical protein